MFVYAESVIPMQCMNLEGYETVKMIENKRDIMSKRVATFSRFPNVSKKVQDI